MSDNPGPRLPVLLDGATATNLFSFGMPHDVCAEKWILENPQLLMSLQEEYVKAGCDVLTAPTFGANRIALSRYGLEKNVSDYNVRLVRLSREVSGGRTKVAGNMSAVCVDLEPFGNFAFDKLVDVYREQAEALKEAGADYVACETFTSLPEARAALIAAKQAGIGATVTLTVDKTGRLLSGGCVLPSLVTLASMGAMAVGINCSEGPQSVHDALSGVSDAVCVPLIAKPSAGVSGKSGHISPCDFASFVPRFFSEGVGIIGGCCGTTPEYIRLMHENMCGAKLDYAVKKVIDDGGVRDFIAANEKQAFFISEESLDFSHKIHCGPELSDRLLSLEGANMAARIAITSVDDAREFGLCSYLAAVPVILLGYDACALDTALRLYQGRAIVDSKSEIPEDRLTEIAERYGAVII